MAGGIAYFLGYSYIVDNINYDVSIGAEGLIWQYTKQIDEKTMRDIESWLRQIIL